MGMQLLSRVLSYFLYIGITFAIIICYFGGNIPVFRIG